MATIILVDDHEIFRNGTKSILKSIGSHDIIEASNGKEFLDILENVKPDIVLMDINMPIMDGVEASEKALSLHPKLKILILSMFDDTEYYNTLVNIGVKGFLLKGCNAEECMVGVYKVLDGKSYFSQDLLSKIKPTDVKSSIEISGNEKEILNLIAKGKSTNEIADILEISYDSMEMQHSNLLSKTNTTSTLQLLIYAVQNDLVRIQKSLN